MRLPATILFLVTATLLALSADDSLSQPASAAALTSARDFYNAGTKLLAEKKYAEAERMFESALAVEEESIQPAALYNMGHTRFAGGIEKLKQGPDAQRASAQGRDALAAGGQAVQNSESALAANDINKMIEAYLEGRGARRQLRDAEKAVTAAMETYGKTLEQWRRADGDFKGASELNLSDTNAVHNAKIVEQGIARLVDSLRKMQDMMGMMGKQRQDLGKLLSKLKGQIPAPNAPPGPAGDDDEDNEGVKPESLAGQKENAGRAGEQMQVQLSPDQANQILNGLSIDGTRRLNMSDKEGKPPADKKGRNW